MRDVIYAAAQSAALAPTKEASSLIPGSSSRPADILLPTWSQGRPAALDVHIISPLQQKTVAEAARTPAMPLTWESVESWGVTSLTAAQLVWTSFHS